MERFGRFQSLYQSVQVDERGCALYSRPMDRVDRDRRTLEAIGRIYCSAHHEPAPSDETELCPACREAIESTLARTLACPNGHDGNCQDCSIKCQRGEAQDRIRTIMAYAAPRMAVRHPLMTFEYLHKKLRGLRSDG